MSETRSELARRRADLVGKLSRIEAEIASVKAEMAARLEGAQGEAQKLRSEIGQIDAEVSRREALDAIVPTISDHALLRFIERVHGVDVEALKADLLTDAVVLAIKSGATGVKTQHGTFVIKGSTVVTFKTPDMDQPKRAPRDRRVSEDEWGV
jgi:hypothetical protein